MQPLIQSAIQTAYPQSTINTPNSSSAKSSSAVQSSAQSSQPMTASSILGMMSGVAQTLVKSNKSAKDPKDSAVGLGAAVLQENLCESLESVMHGETAAVPNEDWAQELTNAGPSQITAKQDLRASFMKGSKDEKFAEKLGLPIPGVAAEHLKGFRD